MNTLLMNNRYSKSPCVQARTATNNCQLTYLSDELDLDAVVLQPLSRIFESDIDLPRHSFTVIEDKMSVLFPIFAFILRFRSRFGVI